MGGGGFIQSKTRPVVNSKSYGKCFAHGLPFCFELQTITTSQFISKEKDQKKIDKLTLGPGPSTKS